MGRVSTQHAIAFMKKGWLPFDGVVVFAWDDFGHFALLQSAVHEIWTDRFRTSLREDPRYSISDCFMTFPLPEGNHLMTHAERLGKTYYEHRATLMQSRNEGLTSTYNRFHDPTEKEMNLEVLRNLQVEMDQAVAIAYGWTDLNLGHGFHETKQGVRFTVTDAARRTVLDSLSALNHQRYSEEVHAGLHLKTQEISPVKRRMRQKKESESRVQNHLFVQEDPQ